ncbi:MAG: family 78 glycoside hydrolase catalytic domain [Verrucomicrobia bacterium]|nr:family 78 glycoside hydrolase catalytic domain [Verrucomicrobiota bacterium]
MMTPHCDVTTAVAVVALRTAGLVDPVGIDVAQPRLSWRMESDWNGAAQSAYQVLCATEPKLLREGAADLWDSGKIASDESQHIRYQGKALKRGVRCHWTVRIWDEADVATEWAAPASWTFFDMTRDRDWQAKWITDNSSSPWLRTTTELKAAPARAMIYVNPLGYFQLFINGTRVGEDEFAPHVGQYDKRTFCITYDVTDCLRPGRNAIGIWLGSGWNKTGAGVSVEPCVRAQLEMVAADGEATTLITDETWRAHPSNRSYRGKWCWNQFGGEEHRGGEELPEWADVEFDDSGWAAATLAEMPDTPVSAEMLQRSRVIETIQPAAVTKLEPGTWLVDMGKAMTGTCEIQLPSGPAGHTVTMQFGDHYEAAPDKAVGDINSFNQVSSYVFRGSGDEIFRNRFNYASFRYILITDVPKGELAPADIKSHFITLDLPVASTFSCSDETLNRIHAMMEHTLRCLMLGGYQVDCHSRERYGYGGDGQSSLDTTLCLLRSDTLYRKWTRDWLDGQKADGELTYTSPVSGHGGGPFWCGFLPAATLKHYHHYGDIDLVRRNYPAIKRWLEQAQSKVVDGLQAQFCGGWFLGDWASPKGVNDKENAHVFIQAYMVYVLKQAAELADVIGETADAATFREWATARASAAHADGFDPAGKRYGSGDQVTYVLPLVAGVTPDDLVEDVFAGFEKQLMVEDKGHLSTGLSGTYLMIQYLQSIERHDLIYSFAGKTTYPSWGYMLENGATATWEHWEGVRSRIHNCYNNIGSWFIQGLAGIRPDPAKPGFKHAIIRPAFVDGIDYVNASHDTLYGTIQSNWRRSADGVTMDVIIPANSTATVYVPAKAVSDVTVNGQSLGEADHVTFVRMEKGRAVIEVGAGRYEFRAR